MGRIKNPAGWKSAAMIPHTPKEKKEKNIFFVYVWRKTER